MSAHADTLVVVGHRRPDLDSIASAIGYAALLCEQGRAACAARCGALDDQSAWALQISGVEPVPFSVDIVGSTATLVAEKWSLQGRALPGPPAKLLLAAILSDTLAFRSPTTTARDHKSAEVLRGIAQIGDLAEFGRQVVTAGAGLGQRPAGEIVQEDYKEYDTAAGHLVVSQAEVRTPNEINARCDELSDALETLRVERSSVLAILLLTDPVRGASRIIASGELRLVGRIPYPRAADGLWDAGAVVSRKTQLVPALLSALNPD